MKAATNNKIGPYVYWSKNVKHCRTLIKERTEHYQYCGTFKTDNNH